MSPALKSASVSNGTPNIAAATDASLAPSATGVLRINLDAIVANWQALSKLGLSASCGAAVKADAYGCGATAVGRALAAAGCKTFFVANLDEARSLRASAPTSNIYVLGGLMPDTASIYAEINVEPVLGDIGELAEWDAFRRKSGWHGGAAIHVDTGMNRLGLTLAEARSLAPRIKAGNHGISLVMTHLACADIIDHSLTAKQVAAFREATSYFPGIPASLANSSGIFRGSKLHFDLLRPGAALYGVNPTPEAPNPMQPVIELQARIVQIRTVARGETVGYGATWTARRPTRLAVIATGYADGYFRAAGGSDGTRGADVIVAGQRCPIAGRVSMDLVSIDITDLPDGAAQRGQLVTLIGDGITIDELAHHYGTIAYELLTSLGNRYVRTYRGGAGIT